MKIHLEYNGTVIEYERHPMPKRHLRALCFLLLAAIAGAVLLGTVHMVGTWAIGGALVGLAAYGLYKLARNI